MSLLTLILTVIIFISLFVFIVKYYSLIQTATYWANKNNDKIYVISDIDNNDITLFLTTSKNTYIKITRWELHKNFIRIY
jgi:hypothetical protein